MLDKIWLAYKSDDAVECIYDTHDESEMQVEKFLARYYDSKEQVQALMNLGDLIHLGQSAIAQSDYPQTSKYDPQYCVTYNSMRCDKWQKAEFASVFDLIHAALQADISTIFLWNDGWQHISRESFKEYLTFEASEEV